MDIPVLSDTSVSVKLFIAALLLGIVAREAWFRLPLSVSANANHFPLPPGPKPDPLIGNLRLMPRDYQWKTFAEWRKRWGSWR